MTLNYEPYKEPLTAVPHGFGFMGTLAKTEDGELIQCHICGNLYAQLGIHAAMKHGVKVAEYKEEFQLAGRTTLVSPAQRERAIKVANEAPEALKALRLANLAAAREIGSHGATWTGKSLEQKNKEGICPDQLLQKIQDLAAVLGRAPSLREFRNHYKGLVHVTYNTFGSWKTAVRLAGLKPARVGRAPFYTGDDLLEMIRRFHKEYDRRPSSADLRAGLLPSAWTYTSYFGSWSNALKEAGIDHE